MKTIGIGVLLQTDSKTFLFQERDYNTTMHPGRITPFGGGIEDGEDVYQCAIRELFEELVLTLDAPRLKDIGLFPTERDPEIYIQMFLAKGIDKSTLRLQEGKDIIELSVEEAIQNGQVTDFTKNVLRSL